MNIYIYIDESGVLHKNDPNKIFLFGGLCFINKNSKEKFTENYKKMEEKIKSDYKNKQELKGNNLKNKHRKYLYNGFKKEKTFVGKVNINNLKEIEWNNKKSIQRYKDWFLVNLIKKQINNLIEKKEININEYHVFNIFVDNQNISTNGIYNFKQSIYKEFFEGKNNFKYDIFFEPIFNHIGKINVKYVDSKKIL